MIALLRDHPDRTPITGGEPTDAVVLVADVAGFTPMSEALARSGHHGIEELGGILNTWFDAMNERIRNYGGSLAEFAGDALIAVFGGGTPARPATARRAVQCALDMQAGMARFQPVPTRAGTFHLTMKVGLAAGPLLQTVMGDPAVRVGPVLLGPALQRAVAAERRARGNEVIAADELVEPGTRDELVERDGRGWLVRGVRRRVAPVPRGRAAVPRRRRERPVGALPPSRHRRATAVGAARARQRAPDGRGLVRRTARRCPSRTGTRCRTCSASWPPRCA